MFWDREDVKKFNAHLDARPNGDPREIIDKYDDKVGKRLQGISSVVLGSSALLLLVFGLVFYKVHEENKTKYSPSEKKKDTFQDSTAKKPSEQPKEIFFPDSKVRK